MGISFGIYFLPTVVFFFGAVYTMFDSPLDRGMSSSNLHFIQYPVVIPDDAHFDFGFGSRKSDALNVHSFFLFSFFSFTIEGRSDNIGSAVL